MENKHNVVTNSYTRSLTF